MKIQEKTKTYYILLSRASCAINALLTALFCAINSESLGNILPTLIVMAILIIISIRGAVNALRTDFFTIVSLYVEVGLISLLCTILLFTKNPLYGIILLICIAIEASLIPVIKYRWKIVNKIKAHFKKKQKNK